MSNKKAILLFIIIGIIAFNELIFSDKIIFGEDVYLYFYHLRAFIRESLLSFELPLWNPYIYCGQPQLGSMQAQIFYPPTIILTPLPPHLMINYIFLLHFILSGIFTYLFAKQQNLDQISSFVSGVVFMFCGFLMTSIKAGHIAIVCSISYLPILLYITELLRKSNKKTKKIKYTCLFGLSIGLQLLAGNPQITYYTWLMLFSYIIYLIFIKKLPLKMLIYYILGFILGVGLAAIVLLPAAELRPYSERADKLPYDFITGWSLPPEGLISFILPGFFAGINNIPWWGRWGLIETYIGIISLLLAIFSLFKREKNFFLFSLIISLILALGKYTPIYKIFYNFFPLFDTFRVPNRCLLIALFSLSLLAGLGLKNFYLVSNKISIILSSIIIFFLLIFLIIDEQMWQKIVKKFLAQGERFVEPTIDEKFFKDSLYLVKATSLKILFLIFIFIGICFFKKSKRIKAIIATLIVIDLLSFSRNYIVSIPYKACLFPEDLINFLKEDREIYRIATLLDDVSLSRGMLYKIENVGGYDPAILRRYAEFINFSQQMPLSEQIVIVRLNIFSKLLNLLNIKYILSTQELSSWALKCIYKTKYLNEDLFVYKNENFINRAFFVEKVHIIKNAKAEDILNKLSTIDLTKEAIIEDTLDINIEESLQKAYVKIINYTPNKIELLTKTFGDAFLVLSDSYYPGWYAYINGEKTKIYKTNYILKGIAIKGKGTKRIELVYRPQSFIIGLYLTTFFSFLFIFLFIYDIIISTLWKRKI